MPITFSPSDTKVEKVASHKPFSFSQLSSARDKAVDFIQGSPNLTDKEAYSITGHSFVQAAYLAYSSHHHLVIRPDDVWIAIMTQFSSYVDQNAEKLRNKFVDFQGKKELTVSSGGSLRTAPYDYLARMMEDQIAKNIKDPSVRSWVVPDFSTTTSTDRVVGAVVLMAAMKNYFSYKFMLLCGLPQVTLLGTVEDWKDVRNRAQRILEFDAGDRRMVAWGKMLFPVLDKFVETASGSPDRDWWQRIANRTGGGSGPRYLSGWITVFSVFSDTGKWIADSSGEWPSVNTNEVAKGLVSVPVTVDDNGTVYETEMHAGHMVVRLADEGTTIIPQLDWCLTLKP